MALRELQAPKRWALNCGPFGSKLVQKDYVESGVPVIRGGNLSSDSRFDLKEFVFVSEEKADDLLPNNAHPGDLVFTQRGTLGQVGIIPEASSFPRYVISQSQMKLTVDRQKADPFFIYYVFKAPETVQRIHNQAFSSGVPHINLEILRSFEIDLPELPAQRRIASILSAYDDLTENNTRRIKILEDMAQMLYREWFVNFRFPGHDKVRMVESDLGLIPEEWEEVKVEEVVQRVPSGKKYDQKTISSRGNIPVFDQGKSGVIGYHDDEPGVIASPDNPIIVFANHTCYQRLVLCPFSAIQNVLPFLPSRFHPRNIYWLHWATKDLIAFNDYKGHWPEFMSKRLLLPSSDVCEAFGDVVGPAVQRQYVLEKANINLRTTRDLLLPKLISGEIPVEAANEAAELVEQTA